jgi:hypothetical protein
MPTLRALLLPLALLFASVAVFEIGARYGAANMRAYGIAGQLELPLEIYANAGAAIDAQSRIELGRMIDRGIATGALHNQTWYLNKTARGALRAVLARALELRGAAALAPFAAESPSGPGAALSSTDRAEIREAILALQTTLAEAEAAEATD